MSRATRDQGFSTVELLISLFIAAAFIATGFQLFSAVTNNSNEARLRSKAATVANDHLQKRTAGAPVPCLVQTPVTNATIPTSDLPQGSYSVEYTCPYGLGARTARATVIVKYGNKAETIRAAIDVTR